MKNIRGITVALKIVALLIIVILLFGFTGSNPTLAQTLAVLNKETFSYTLNQSSLKDEQNIDFLYKVLKDASLFPDDSPTNSEDEVLKKSLKSRKDFSQYYYSSEDPAFALRELVKLTRVLSCKASRLTGIRGLKLANTLPNLIDKIKSLEDDPKDKQISFGSNDANSWMQFWQAAYEHFCPDLW